MNMNFILFIIILYRWLAQEWRACLPTCGDGTQTRLVQCVRFTKQGSAPESLFSNECDRNTRPESRRACNLGPCTN